MSQPTPTSPDDWETHWASFAETMAFNPAQAYRRRLLVRWLRSSGADRANSPSTPVRVLDLGCGQGDLLAAVATASPTASLAGLELSAEGTQITRNKVPTATVLQRNLLADADGPPVDWLAATHVVCCEVVEHVDDPSRLLRAGLQYAAPGAKVLVSCPSGPMNAFERHIGHRRHHTRSSLRTVLESASLVDVRVHARGWPFFNLYKVAGKLRGEAAITDAGAQPGLATRAALAVFDLLLRLNPPLRRGGWQLIATAIKPERDPHPDLQ